jgi:hypothetical protein
MKHVTLGDFLTEEQIAECVALFEAHDNSKGSFASVVCERVIAPNMAAINAKLGQENNAKYLAYAVEYVLTSARMSS